MIGIIGAMDVEVNKFKEQMIGVSTETIAGTEFVCGTLWGHPAVVAVSGVGKADFEEAKQRKNLYRSSKNNAKLCCVCWDTLIRKI